MPTYASYSPPCCCLIASNKKCADYMVKLQASFILHSGPTLSVELCQVRQDHGEPQVHRGREARQVGPIDFFCSCTVSSPSSHITNITIVISRSAGGAHPVLLSRNSFLLISPFPSSSAGKSLGMSRDYASSRAWFSTLFRLKARQDHNPKQYK